MKFRFTGALRLAALCLALAVIPSRAQSSDPSQSGAQPAAKRTQPSPQQAQPQPKGQVIFSRSIDENGETVTQSGPGVQKYADITTISAPSAEDAERLAVTFTDLNLDVHLRPAEHHIAVRALVTVRNDGAAPLAHIPLQISSSLTWERIRLNGNDAAFTVAALNSDTDHTGQLHEAAVTPPSPLPPGGAARLDVTYSGVITRNAQRLLALGTPDDAALHSDWDQIATEFTGLRGFGNVVWYPVSSVPVILGDGARVFDEIGRHKRGLFGAAFRLRLSEEYLPGQTPNVALVNGRPVALTVTDSAPGSEVAGVASVHTDMTTLGFEAPSLFIATREPHAMREMTVWTLPGAAQAVDAWTAAAAVVKPFLQGWLGEQPHSRLTVLDLPDGHDAPFETGALLAAPVLGASPQALEGALVHALTHSWRFNDLQPQPAWLDEGVAAFMGSLWIEKQQDREAALESLEADRPALALVEPPSPGDSAGQPLAAAIAPIYYRTKAAYVLWMLRDIAGETALSAALRASAQESNAKSPSLKSSFELLLEKSGPRRDLAWFFADWVETDKGLPDLSIESAFPNQTTDDSWLIAVNVANAGYAAAEVPLTVRSAGKSVTERVLIPARGKVSQRILIQGKPTEVRLNDGAVPETQASVHVLTLDREAQPGPAQP